MSVIAKIYSNLTKADRKRAAVLLGLMVIGMGLETLGIGLVIPVISLLMQGDLVARYPQLEPLLVALGNPTQTQLIMGTMAALVGIYLIKTLFLGFLAWRQVKLGFGVQAQLSQRLFTTYLRQPYTFHLQRNSAKLIRNILSEVAMFSNVLTQSMSLLAEALVVLGIAILLLAVEPVGAVIVAAVLATAAGIFHFSTRGRIARWGLARQHHEGLRIQHLQQGLGGAKDVKLLGREDDFLARYGMHNAQSVRAGQLQATLQQMPRLWLELLAVAGLATLVTTMLAQGRQIAAIVPIVGLFAAAAFRLMPSVNRILVAAQLLRYGSPVINNLHEELKLVVPDPPPKSSTKSAFKEQVELSDVSFTYPLAAGPALDGLTLAIHKGESVGFVGPSGSGKSTLVDVILGLLTPTTGRVLVDGSDIQLNLRAWQDQVGYVPQTIYLTDDSLQRNVAFGLANEQIDALAVRRAIRAAQLEDFVATLPDGLETVVGERGVRLSGGQRQRIGIARALYHNPQVLVLDEATSALDTVTEQGIMESVTALRRSKTILIVAHRSSTVQYCDRLYRLDRGKVVDTGSPQALLITAERSVPTAMT
jgi:ABC-type multidrug transport system fused ATPase/permease subunit